MRKIRSERARISLIERESGERTCGVTKKRTVFPAFCLAAVFVFSVAGVIRADAPEDKVWSDAPKKSEPCEMGPRNGRVEPDRYHQILYVSANRGDDVKGDGSAARPWASISRAIAGAVDAGRGNRWAILVAEGTYEGETVVMKPYVDLYGGFEAVNWERDIYDNRTVLDGQGARRVVEGADNCRLDGFVITGGRSRGHGAGILCHRTSPVISNNIITGNSTLEPVGFVHDPQRRRHVGNDGGGIACVDGANPLIAHNIIFNNTTEVGNGAGIACRDDSCPKIIYNVILDNRTGLKDVHETRSSNGGGISCFAGVQPIINNNLIADNSAGGGSDGGAVYYEYNCSGEARFNYILGNRSDDDGGACEIMKCSQPRISLNVFAGNCTEGGGGAIRLSDQGLARIRGNVICRNLARGKGGGVACTNAWMILENNTIVENSSKRSGGVIYYNENWPQLMPPILTNNTIRDNVGKQLDVGSEGARIEYNNVEGGFAGIGNTDKEPSLEDDGFELKASSSAYDANRCVTILSYAGKSLDGGSLAGRVVRVGSKWSMVKSGGLQDLVVWGKMSGEGLDLEIMSGYYSCRSAVGVTVAAKP